MYFIKKKIHQIMSKTRVLKQRLSLLYAIVEKEIRLQLRFKFSLFLKFITPIIGISNLALKELRLKLEEVLHAATIAFTLKLSKKLTFSILNLVTVPLDFEPYGTLAVSPK